MLKRILLALIFMLATMPVAAQNVYPGKQVTSNATVPGTFGMIIPHGPTSGRPAHPGEGTVRTNTQNGFFEWWSSIGGWHIDGGGSGTPVPATTNGVIIWDGSKFITDPNFLYYLTSGSAVHSFHGAGAGKSSTFYVGAGDDSSVFQLRSTASNQVVLGLAGAASASQLNLYGTSNGTHSGNQINLWDGGGFVRFYNSANDGWAMFQPANVASGHHVYISAPDADSNTIQPLGSATSGQFVQYIDSSGTQHLAAAGSSGSWDTPTPQILNGSVSGICRVIQVEAGTYHKKVIIELSTWNDVGQRVTFSVPFMNPPLVKGSTTSYGGSPDPRYLLSGYGEGGNLYSNGVYIDLPDTHTGYNGTDGTIELVGY